MNVQALAAAAALNPRSIVDASTGSGSFPSAGDGLPSRAVAIGTLLLAVGAVVGIVVLAVMAVVIAVMIARLQRDARVSRASLLARVAQIRRSHFAVVGVGLSLAITVVQGFIAAHQDWVAATWSGADAVPALSQVFAGHLLTVVVLLISAGLVVASLTFLYRAIGSTIRLLRSDPTQ